MNSLKWTQTFMDLAMKNHGFENHTKFIFFIFCTQKICTYSQNEKIITIKLNFQPFIKKNIKKNLFCIVFPEHRLVSLFGVHFVYEYLN